jgi:hypothetical protein
MLFLTNPFFENKYRDAEKNVQIFKQEHYSEYDSLLRDYDIQFEIIQFRKDSIENVIEQKYTILRHELEMQKLKEIISKDAYNEKYDETFELEVAEISMVKDTFYESLTRLDRPEEIKVPRYLSKKVILFRNVDGLIGFMKWLLLVYVIIIIGIVYFDKKKLDDRNIIPSRDPDKIAESNKKEATSIEQQNSLIEIEGRKYIYWKEIDDNMVALQEVAPDELGNLAPVENQYLFRDKDEFEALLAEQQAEKMLIK